MNSMVVARPLAFLLPALLCGVTLQGCQFDVPRHLLGNWESKTNYLSEYQFVPPGKPATSAILNSCSNPNITAALQCNGHGRCRDWFQSQPVAGGPKLLRLAFCECDFNWADPECRTPRKSQITAFALSLFVGFFGVDQFYLGYPIAGVFKLITLGGCGLWYLFDVCRIGSSQVLTKYNFRVAADLPHYAFVLTVLSAMFFYGFLFSILSIVAHRHQKAHEVMMIRIQAEEDEEEESVEKAAPIVRQVRVRQPPTQRLNSVPFTGYGTTLGPRSMPATMPPASVPGTMPPTSGPPSMRSVDTLPPDAFPPGSIPPATMPSGSFPPATFPPGTFPHGMPPASMASMPPASMASMPPASMGPGPSMVPTEFSVVPRTSVMPPGPPGMATAPLQPVPSTFF